MMLFSWISPIALTAGVIGAVLHWSKLSTIHKFIFIFICTSLVIDIISRYAMKWFNLDSNLSIFSIYVFVEYFFLGVLYNHFFPTKKSKLLLYTTLFGGGIIVLLLFSKLAPVVLSKFQFYEGLVANFFGLFFGLFFIYKLLVDDLNATSQIKSLNSMIIMYAGIQFFMALTINFMVNMKVELVTTFWLIRLLAITIFYSKLSYTLWKPGKMVIQ